MTAEKDMREMLEAQAVDVAVQQLGTTLAAVLPAHWKFVLVLDIPGHDAHALTGTVAHTHAVHLMREVADLMEASLSQRPQGGPH